MELLMKAYNAAEEELIKKLSKMYNFDAKEAKNRLHASEEPSVPLPFTGEIKSDWCLGMKKNHNLYSQCTSKRINDRLCNKCQKEEDKLGKVKEGYIEERLSCNLMDYKDVQNYGNVLEKLNITKEKAMEEAARFNIVIPEEQFEVKKKVAQRGRPANSKQPKKEGGLGDVNPPKEVVLNNKKDEEETTKVEKKVEENATPKKRGRPKKEQKKVVNNCGEELIAALVNEAQKKESEDVFETAKKAKQEAKKKAEQAKLEEQRKQEEKKKQEEQAKLEEEKKKAEQAKKEEAKKAEEKKIVIDELCEEEVDEDESEEDCDEEGVRGNEEFPCEEEITVSKFEFNGIKYLKSSDNILYDPISQDPVGIWNEDDECIDEIEEDDE